MRQKMETRVARLERRAPPAGNVRTFLLAEHDPLPLGVGDDDDNVMIVRLIGAKPPSRDPHHAT